MALEYNQPYFWEREAEELFNELAPLALEIYFQGGAGGEALLPPGAQVLIDWDVYNRDAVNWLNTWKRTIFAEFEETTRNNVTDAINEWVLSGESMPVLEAKLSAFFGAQRAEMIATTEVTRMYAEGNIAAWKASNVVGGNRWMTAQDELVCLICKPLANMVADLDSNGFTTEFGDIGLNGPPAHPRCRCWLQPVVDDKLFEEEIDRILNS